MSVLWVLQCLPFDKTLNFVCFVVDVHESVVQVKDAQHFGLLRHFFSAILFSAKIF